MAEITGTDSGELLVGTGQADVIWGKRGDDTILAGDGDDAIVHRTGDGADQVDGEGGFDTAYFSNGTGVNITSLYLRRDPSLPSGSFTFSDSPGNSGAATFASVERAYFSFGSIKTGIVLTDLTGSGLQSIYINHAGDLALIVTTPAMNIPIIAFAGAGETSLRGGSGDDIFVAGTGRAVMAGNAGNDFLAGSGLGDMLDGGTGTDTLIGYAGDDIYYVDSRSDSVIEAAGEGHDTVYSTANFFFLPINVEVLEFSSQAGPSIGVGNSGNDSIKGTASADTLIGDAGNDRLDSGGGLDTLIGGIGDDIYLVDQSGASAVEYANEGTDLVITLSLVYQLGVNLENLTYAGTGSESFLGVGNDLDNLIESAGGADILIGQGGADRLIGGGGADLLDGGAGNDRLEGGAGADNLYGAGGSDVFVATTVQQGVDLIHDFARGEGDKIDITLLLTLIGKTGAQAFGEGYLTFQATADFNGLGAATRVMFDPDASAGPQGQTTFLVSLGSDPLVQGDFIV